MSRGYMGGRLRGGGRRSSRKRKDMLKFHSTEHESQIEHELNKCIRKPNETTWNYVLYIYVHGKPTKNNKGIK